MNSCGFVFENNRCNKDAQKKHKWNDRFFCEQHYLEVSKAREKLKQELIDEYKEKLINWIEKQYMTSGYYSHVYLPISSEWLIGAIKNGDFD